MSQAPEESHDFLCQCLRHPSAEVRQLAELALKMSAYHELLVVSLHNAGVSVEDGARSA